MKPEELLQIENEVFTKLVIEKLQEQKEVGKPIKYYLLVKHEIDQLTQERVRKIVIGG